MRGHETISELGLKIRSPHLLNILEATKESKPSVQYKGAEARRLRSMPATTFGPFWLLMKPGRDVQGCEDDGSLKRYDLV